MFVYLVLFSNEAPAGIQMLVAKKKMSGHFFSGGYINNRDFIVPGNRVNNDLGVTVQLTGGRLFVGGKCCMPNVPARAVTRIFQRLGAIGVYDGENLLKTIYVNGYPLRNYPGQYVLCGGKKEFEEASGSGALREFSEETGIDLGGRSAFVQRFLKDGQVVSSSWVAPDWGATYIKVTNAELLEMARRINANLSLPDYRDRMLHLPDDELESVAAWGLENAIREFRGDPHRDWLATAGEYLRDNILQIEEYLHG